MIELKNKTTEKPKVECPFCGKELVKLSRAHTDFCKKNPNKRQKVPCEFCGKRVMRPRLHYRNCSRIPQDVLREQFMRPETKKLRERIYLDAIPLAIYVSESQYKKYRGKIVQLIEERIEKDLLLELFEVQDKIDSFPLPDDRKTFCFSIPLKLKKKLIEMRREGYFLSYSKYIRYVMNMEDEQNNVWRQQIFHNKRGFRNSFTR